MKDPKNDKQLSQLFEVFMLVPKEKQENVLNFLLDYMKTETKVTDKDDVKFGLSWIGSLAHLGPEINTEILEKEIKELWTKIDQ